MGDPVPSAAIFDATTGGRSVIVVTGGSTGDVLTLQANGTYAAATPAGGSLSGTGAVDNAVLRADGTGGATLQNSAIVIADNYTASPNNTVNHASIQATGGTTDVSVSIVPKGTGAFTLAVPDGTSAGGNVRGANAIDLQTIRSTAAQVASASRSVLIGAYGTASGSFSVSVGDSNVASSNNTTAVGSSNTASNNTSCAVGYANTANNSSLAVGVSNTASGVNSAAFGINNTASGTYSVACGAYATANQLSQRSRASVYFASQGDSQEVGYLLRRKTTDATPTELSLSHVDATLTRLAIASGKIGHYTIRIIGSKSDGSAICRYLRQITIANVAGTTSLVGTEVTLGTDVAAGTAIAITADNTNDALIVTVTGIASETWRWWCQVDGSELAYGS